MAFLWRLFNRPDGQCRPQDPCPDDEEPMIPFPQISPEIFTVNLFGLELALRWYALAYLVGLLIGWRIMVMLMRRPALWGDAAPMRPEQVEELLTWVILGVVLGGRLGFVLF
jgi:phosphatidylglycerol:prolipoprotein diacylglycerol transferase